MSRMWRTCQIEFITEICSSRPHEVHVVVEAAGLELFQMLSMLWHRPKTGLARCHTDAWGPARRMCVCACVCVLAAVLADVFVRSSGPALCDH